MTARKPGLLQRHPAYGRRVSLCLNLELLVAGLLGLAAGCAPSGVQTEGVHRGCIVMLPGVENGAWQFSLTTRGLRKAGVCERIEVIEWGDKLFPINSLTNLMDYPRNQERAHQIAGQLAEIHIAHRGEPLFLVGYSGGGGMALLVAEALSREVVLDRLILIGAAMSPRYDVNRVLPHAREVVSFYSENDWFMLGVGTRTFGTIDRQHQDSAGRVGFRDAQGRLLQTPGFRQVAWTSDWIRLGHDGGHLGWLSGEWAREVLSKEVIVPQ